MRIDEIFNSSVEWEWETDPMHPMRRQIKRSVHSLLPGKSNIIDNKVATFEIDGEAIGVGFTLYKGKKEWVVMFGSSAENKVEFTLTNRGRAISIFSTIKAIIQDFMQNVNPAGIEFQAASARHEQFYDKLASMFKIAGMDMKKDGKRYIATA